MKSQLRYVLITPARDEARCIEATIVSVISQELLPVRWVIVDDASSDETWDIAAKYARHYSFITVVRRPKCKTRSFGSKVEAFNAGLKVVENESYEVLGNLDADIVLKADYYSNMMAAFEREPELGIAGGVIYVPVRGRYETQDMSCDSVGGAVQLFRRECFRQIGGYLPIERGGIDAAAEIMARMHRWAVRKIANNPVYEQRRTGFAYGRPWRVAYKEGGQYHRLGYSTLFYCIRCAYRIGDRPVLLGGLLGLLGFCKARVLREPVCLPADVVAYLRREQLNKIRKYLVSGGGRLRAS